MSRCTADTSATDTSVITMLMGSASFGLSSSANPSGSVFDRSITIDLCPFTPQALAYGSCELNVPSEV